MRSRKAERKPLSFSTTMRNPNRIVSFLNCLLPYENQILTHDVIMKVVHNAIKEKLYTPVVVNRTPDLVYILRSEDEKYSDKQIEYIIEMSPQKHKEAGFEYGWDSRFVQYSSYQWIWICEVCDGRTDKNINNWAYVD